MVKKIKIYRIVIWLSMAAYPTPALVPDIISRAGSNVGDSHLHHFFPISVQLITCAPITLSHSRISYPSRTSQIYTLH